MKEMVFFFLETFSRRVDHGDVCVHVCEQRRFDESGCFDYGFRITVISKKKKKEEEKKPNRPIVDYNELRGFAP
jgi:hypothetical protein